MVRQATKEKPFFKSLAAFNFSSSCVMWECFFHSCVFVLTLFLLCSEGMFLFSFAVFLHGCWLMFVCVLVSTYVLCSYSMCSWLLCIFCFLQAVLFFPSQDVCDFASFFSCYCFLECYYFHLEVLRKKLTVRFVSVHGYGCVNIHPMIYLQKCVSLCLILCVFVYISVWPVHLFVLLQKLFCVFMYGKLLASPYGV